MATFWVKKMENYNNAILAILGLLVGTIQESLPEYKAGFAKVGNSEVIFNPGPVACIWAIGFVNDTQFGDKLAEFQQTCPTIWKCFLEGEITLSEEILQKLGDEMLTWQKNKDHPIFYLEDILEQIKKPF